MYEIKIYVTNEEEIYNRFDNTKNTLSSDLTNYIMAAMEDRPIGEAIRIVFSSQDYIDSVILERAFVNYFKSLEKRLKKEKNRSFLQSMSLLIIGIIFVIIGVVLGDNISVVLATIISTIGSFTIWEAANRWIIELPRLRIENRILHFLQDYEITTEIV